jgi:hypothetical protein
MRYTTRLVLAVLLAAVNGADGFTAETKAPWWHFGMGQDTPTAPATVAPAPTMAPATTNVTPVDEESWFPKPSLPKLSWFDAGSPDEAAAAPATQAIDPLSTSSSVTARTQPRQPRTHFGKPLHRPRPRNTWAQPSASTTTEAPSTSPWRSMSDGTRTAWHKTVDFVTPGDGSDAPVVRSEPHESWWRRMWGSEQEKNEGPQTVTEWMAQDRLDP